MEFKDRPKQKRFDPDNTGSQDLNWNHEDDEWGKLLGEVEKDVEKKRKRSIFPRRHESSFDVPKDKKPVQKVEINLKLTLPKTKLKFLNKFRARKPKTIYLAAALILILAIAVVGKTLLNHNKYKGSEVAGVTSSTDSKNGAQPQLPREKPPFKILYPAGKDASVFGDPVRVSPSNNDPVYAYTDNISDTEVILSQQKIPSSFEGNTSAQLEKVAKNFQATDSFSVDSVTVFYGKSSSGVQSLVFIKGNLLVFIKSPSELSQEVWAAYISALH